MKSAAVLAPSIAPQTRPEPARDASPEMVTSPIAKKEPVASAVTTPTVTTASDTDSENKATVPNLLRWVGDAAYRALARLGESFCENPYLRVLYRGGTEIGRKTGELVGYKAIVGEKIQSSDWMHALVRSAENTVGSAILEPSLYTNRLARMGVGFLNMVARAATRGIMFAANLIQKQELGLEHFVDEGLSRTLCRGIFIDSSPSVRTAMSFVEQFGINAWVHNLPATKMLQKFSSKKAA
jgi:hypothetical protein